MPRSAARLGFHRILRWTLPLLFAAWLCACPAAAQSDADLPPPLTSYFREVWTTREGLPHNLVNRIAQTPDGYLWFGTWEGAARYNGREFALFDRERLPGLADNGVRTLHTGPDGTLWVGTSRGGVARLRDRRWRFYTQQEGLGQDEIMDVAQDAAGTVWIATESAGVDRIAADGTITHFRREHGLPSDITYSVATDPAGRAWVGTAGGLAVIEQGAVHHVGAEAGLDDAQVFALHADADGLLVGTESGAFASTPGGFAPLSPELPADSVQRVLRDSRGSIWIGTVNYGLFRVSGRGVEQIDVRHGLPNNRVAALFEDRERSLWVGTNAGLFRLRDAPFTSYLREQGLSDGYVRTVLEHSDGTLWVGTSKGLDHLPAGGDRFAAVEDADDLLRQSVLSLAEGRDGAVLVGTYAGGLVRWKDGRVLQARSVREGLVGTQVRAVLETAAGVVWVGTNRGLSRIDGDDVRNFHVADGLPRDFIIALHEARDGRVWVGTSNGLAVIEEDSIRAIDLRNLDGAQDVFGFFEEDDGTLWLATDRALVRMRGGQLRQIGRRHGLPIETIFQVVGDRVGGLWLTSNRGVMRIALADAHAVADGTRAQLDVELFGEADGMASAQCNGGSGPVAALRRDDTVWIGTANGVSAIDPARREDFQRQVPPVVIEDVLIDDRRVEAERGIVVPPGARRLELHFAGLSYLMPQKIRYRYRLEGFDETWVDRGSLRFAQFTNLRPGDYRFRVTAANPNGTWSRDEAAVLIRVEPYLWQRTGFWALLGAALLAAAYVAYRVRVRGLQAAERRMRELVEVRTLDLRRQTERLQASDAEKSQLLDQLRAQADAFERQAREDALTGLANRRNFDEILAREFARAQRSGSPLCVALLDLDHFKRINDNYSHAAGDAALRLVADTLRRQCREMDAVARYGGEEFVLKFPDTSLDDARRVCERIRRAIEQLDCSAFAPGLTITVSIGVASHAGLNHYEKLISRADAAMYEAKQGGRNRVCG